MVLAQQEGLLPSSESTLNSPAYTSPFEMFNGNPSVFAEFSSQMHYHGTCESVIKELSQALNIPDTFQPEIPLHPPRLLRGIIQWKINHPDEGGEEYIQDAVAIAHKVYANHPEAVSMLGILYDKLHSEKSQLLAADVEENVDTKSWEATQPNLSYRTAEELASYIGNADTLFIAIANGGIPAGLDVFNRYRNITNSDSIFYPSRLSMYDMLDTVPQVSSVEREWLSKMSEGREIVIFDEDKSSGETLHTAASHFCALFGTYSVYVKSNLIPSNKNYF